MGDDVTTVNTTKTPVATESTETPPPAAETLPTPTRSERINALTGKGREHWRLTGNLEAAEGKIQPKTSTEETSSPGAEESARTEPASGPGSEQQQNVPRGTESRTRQDRNFRSLSEKASTLERELIETKAKLSVYESERAASRQPAPAASEIKPADTDSRPQFPDIEAFEDAKKFNLAVKAWQTQDADWMQRQLDRRLNGERQTQQHQQSSERWNAQIETARKQFKDFDQVVFSDKAPLSYATLAVIQSIPDGAIRSYGLAKNLEIATKIAELTHIPGEAQFKSLGEFLAWVKADPDRAMLYGEKLALAKAEIAKLSVNGKSAAAPAPQRPLKELIRSAAQPSAEVNTETSATPVLDPIATALKNHDFKTYKRLQNEADLRARRMR